MTSITGYNTVFDIQIVYIMSSCRNSSYFSEPVSSTTSPPNDSNRWYFRLKESSKLFEIQVEMNH